MVTAQIQVLTSADVDRFRALTRCHQRSGARGTPAWWGQAENSSRLVVSQAGAEVDISRVDCDMAHACKRSGPLNAHLLVEVLAELLLSDLVGHLLHERMGAKGNVGWLGANGSWLPGQRSVTHRLHLASAGHCCLLDWVVRNDCVRVGLLGL
jgi:hypothetical protein